MRGPDRADAPPSWLSLILEVRCHWLKKPRPAHDHVGRTPDRPKDEIAQNEPEPTPSDDTAPSPQLGLDAEGTAGGDSFGLAARKIRFSKNAASL